jgi:hypothetical protein
MFSTVVFHKISEDSGAGPFEYRVNPGSPWIWGHSYCNKFWAVVSVVASLTETSTETLLETAAKEDNTIKETKTKIVKARMQFAVRIFFPSTKYLG